MILIVFIHLSEITNPYSYFQTEPDRFDSFAGKKKADLIWPAFKICYFGY